MPWWKCFECMNLRDVDDIRVLDFSHHLLHDVPPDVYQYERTLEELHLNANRIADLPRQLFYCQELKVLNLNDNELVALPPAISSLTSLQRLSLSKNALNGIVENIKGCKHLTMLDISLNGFIKLPDPVTSVVSLQELYLNDTSLEFLPANFGRLVNLRILELRDNNLSTLPKSMARLVQLTRLDIGSNEFTELPEVIGQLVNLTELWLDSNRIRRVSANVGNLTKLVHFEASNNLLTHLPNEVANWTRLQELSISVNDFKQLPFSIGMMRSLVALKADENNLQELPDSISQLENLEEIMVSHNDLFRLPPSIGLLRRLRFLTADENLLRTLPTELCSCVALTLLSVRGNKLTEVPLDIGHLRNLRVINIVNNFITHLPVSVLNLQQLSALWISDNQSQPLMPLQKDYGPEQSVRLTCFMLPQTAGSHGGKQNGGGMMMDKDRLDPQMRHLTAKQMADLDEKAAMMSPPPDGAAAAGKRRICFASDPVTPTTDAAARLMRSPTPYPKELRILAKYARYVHTNGQTEYVHVDDLRAAGGQPMPEHATAGIELHEAATPTMVNGHGAPLEDPTATAEGQVGPIHAGAGGDEADAAARCYEEVAARYAPAGGLLHHQLPPNFQPTLSPLLGDDELDARAAYFYATAEQKITTPVPQIVDYENVSLCSSGLMGVATSAARPGLMAGAQQQQQLQQPQQQSIYGTTTVSGSNGPVALPTMAERPASEVRMSQASSFGDGGSLSSAFGMNGMAHTNGAAGTRSPAMLPQQQLQQLHQQHPQQQQPHPQQQQQYYPYVQQSPSQHHLHQNGGGGSISAAEEDVVYYAASQGSDSNYGHLPGAAWQQQQNQLNQTLHGSITGGPQHYGNNADRVSLASDYARSEMSSASGMMQMQQQQAQLRQPPPYHIARAYTKKSKSDLMHYEQFRTHNGSLNGDAGETPPPQQQQQQQRHGTPPIAIAVATSMMPNGHQLYTAEPAERETDATQNPQQQQQQQPLIYYSNGTGGQHSPNFYNNRDEQQQQQQHQQQQQYAESIYASRTPTNGVDSNRNHEQNGGGGVDDDHHDDDANDDDDAEDDDSGAAAPTSASVNISTSATAIASPQQHQQPSTVAGAITANKSPWLFGLHKNPKVMQLSVPKTLDIGFQLTQSPAGPGIFVGAVDANSIVNTLLRQHDKVLEMDGVDFTRIALADALTVLSNAGPVINVMVSRI